MVILIFCGISILFTFPNFSIFSLIHGNQYLFFFWDRLSLHSSSYPELYILLHQPPQCWDSRHVNFGKSQSNTYDMLSHRVSIYISHVPVSLLLFFMEEFQLKSLVHFKSRLLVLVLLSCRDSFSALEINLCSDPWFVSVCSVS
jgi:hypothetical protein